MDAEKLESVASRLEAEKRRLSKTIETIEETGISLPIMDSISELSNYDNHPADLGSEMFERSKDLALRDNENVLISEIEHALAKVYDGTYGQCEVCGKAIPEARLDAIPWAVACIECQKNVESHDIATRPIEEYSLQPPFGRTFLDFQSNENVGFDGEDSLQAVWQYGSSDSPQDLPGSHDYSDLNIDPHEQQGIVDPADIVPARADGSQDTSPQGALQNRNQNL